VNPASFAQRRLWFLDQLSGGSPDALLPLAMRIRGALDVAALERALAGILARHEVLRTRFVPRDGEPEPRVDPPTGPVLERTEAGGVAELFGRELSRPMDLAVERPFRATLARIAPDDHLLLIVVHHIAVDGWSWDILLRELAAGYAGDEVAPPPVRYAEVARAEAERLRGPKLARHLAYWKERLAGLRPLALPTDRPRPARFDGAGDVVRFVLPAALASEVDGLARERRATRYMVLLSVYQALLAHYSGQQDLAVCSTLADRGRPELENLIGPFVNTAVLRANLAGAPTFAALLDRTKRGVLADLAHARAPFDKVVGELGAARDLSRHPLAQASFTLLNVPQRSAALPGLAVELIAPPLRGTPMDVFLDLCLLPDGRIAAALQYAIALFDRATMERFAAGYRDLLRAVLASPDAPVTELAAGIEPLPGLARRRIVTDWSHGPAVTPLPVPLTAGGTGTALVCGDTEVSYADLDGLTGGVASALVARGAGRGTAIGVLTSRGAASVAAMFAAWRIGGAYVPLDAALPVRRLRYMVGEAGVGVVVADAGTAALARQLGVPVVSTVDVEPGNHPQVAVEPADLAYVIFTSGSSGRPKAVGIEHRAIAAHVAAARDLYRIGETDRVLAFSSFAFDASLDQLLPALSRGASVVVRTDEHLAPGAVPALVERHAISVANLPPTYWAELAASLTDQSVRALAPLRLLILGGEPVPAGPLARWRSRLPGVRVVNAYGPTETTVTATTHTAGDADPQRVPIGRPLGNRRVYVVDADGNPAGVGEPGELLIGGPELARGYLGRPGLTADRFVPDPYGDGGRLYRTGDLVRWLPSGELEFAGRLDDQVKLRGFRIELGEVEAVLADCPGVTGAAAALRPDAHGGQRLVGYLVGSAAEPPRDWCARWLPDHAVPAEFVTLAALPVTASGKLDRAALPAEAGVSTIDLSTVDSVAPRDEVEQAIADIWAEVLGVPRVGLDDSFFDLGGHSLLATMATSRIAQRLGRDVELRTLFEQPCIREYAPAVVAARAAGTAVVPVDRSGPLPLSFAQERLWFLDRMSQHGEEYVLWFSWRVRGGLDRAAWQGALDDVLERHEVLRTALVEVDGKPVQVVRPARGVPLDWQRASTVGGVAAAAHAFATRRFDLARPPLVRAGVWELAADDHVAVVAFHHVATDGWSNEILVAELNECYHGRRGGLPALPVQYGDFAVWQRDAGTAALLERQLGYWRAQLAGVPVLELPADRPRPAAPTGRGAALEVAYDPGLVARLDELARRCGATRFMVLLAVAQVVLGRWAGQPDVPVGTPVAGRGRTELERLVGFFVNTLVLRGDTAGNPAFTELLERVRGSVLGAFDHQDVPFERLVEELRPDRAAGRNPLFQVMFDVQEASGRPSRLDGLDVTAFPLPWGSAKFDLTATFLVYPDRFALCAEYSTDLFDAATIERFGEHVGLVLDAVCRDPGARIGDIDLRGRAALALAGTGSAALQGFSLAGAPADVAVACGPDRWSYAQTEAHAVGLADLLGDRRGQAVGVCLPRGVWSVAALLGSWHAGAAYVPLDPALPAERLRYMVREAGITVVVGGGDPSDPSDLGVPSVRVADVVPAVGPLRANDPAALAYVIFTSGSTGRPKAVGVEHGPLGAHVAAARERFGLTAADRVLNFASHSFDASLEQLLPALSVGARVVLRPDEVWSMPELSAAVQEHGITVLELTPSYWAALVGQLPDVDFRGVRLLVTGGEVLPPGPLARWFAALPGVPVMNTYGPTESVISTTTYEVRTSSGSRIPIGRPLGGRRLYVLDRRGEPAPFGVPGELYVGGPELARGYLGRPALTAERFVPDPYGTGGRLYRTGDLVRWLPSGELDFLGRCDDQVKIRGFRIEPGEVEAVLREHPGVREAAVLARELRGEPALVGYVAGRASPAELADWCRARLPSYAVPAAFVPLAALPLTVQGKLDTAALPAPELPAAAGFVAPGTPTEVVTAQIWSAVLGVAAVGVHDDFFALGGHSLHAVAVAARLRTAFDCPITVRDLFEHPTVALLATEVERQLVELISAMSDDEIALSLTADLLD
jgi:amino acid adenylation domain-containing protein